MNVIYLLILFQIIVALIFGKDGLLLFSSTQLHLLKSMIKALPAAMTDTTS